MNESHSISSAGLAGVGCSVVGSQGGGYARWPDTQPLQGFWQYAASPIRGWAFLVSALYGVSRNLRGRLGVLLACGWGFYPARSNGCEQAGDNDNGHSKQAGGWLVPPLKDYRKGNFYRAARGLASYAGSRGFIDPLTLVLIGGFAAGVFAGTWKPFLGLKKGPQTAQLSQLQSDLVSAQEAAKQARIAQEGAAAAERAKMGEQLRSAQGDALGVVTALKKVPEGHKTPEVRLASSFAGRLEYKLGVTIGALPADQRDAILTLIEEALSGKQAEVEEAQRKLAALDAAFQATTKARDALQQQIPLLEAEARKMAEKAQSVQVEVTAKTNEVKQWADKTDAAQREAGSLGAAFWKMVYLLGFLAVGWVVLAFGVPLVLKTMRPSPFKSVLRDVSGFAVGGLHFSDARAKLSKFNQTP